MGQGQVPGLTEFVQIAAGAEAGPLPPQFHPGHGGIQPRQPQGVGEFVPQPRADGVARLGPRQGDDIDLVPTLQPHQRPIGEHPFPSRASRSPGAEIPPPQQGGIGERFQGERALEVQLIPQPQHSCEHRGSHGASRRRGLETRERGVQAAPAHAHPRAWRPVGRGQQDVEEVGDASGSQALRVDPHQDRRAGPQVARPLADCAGVLHRHHRQRTPGQSRQGLRPLGVDSGGEEIGKGLSARPHPLVPSPK